MAVAELAVADDLIDLARGDQFADALTGGIHTGSRRAPVLLTGNPTTDAPATLGHLSANYATLSELVDPRRAHVVTDDGAARPRRPGSVTPRC